MTAPLFERVALIGLGLIGSSLARAIQREGVAAHIAGHDANANSLAKSLEIGFIDSAHADIGEAVTGADLIVICTPLGAYDAVGRALNGHVKPGAIVSDVGSCKASVFEDMAKCLPAGVHLIPGHPVAGTENSGPESGFAHLFENRYVILTPPKDVDPAALEKLKSLWAGLGAMVELMDAAHHDRVLAITSHLPHLIAYTIVGTAADLEGQLKREQADETSLVETGEVIRFSAGGFRDFTRIAGSNPIMWRDIFLKNREAVLEMLGRLTEDLIGLQRAIRWGEADVLEDWFTRTREIRRGVVEQGQAGRFIATEPESEPDPDLESDPR